MRFTKSFQLALNILLHSKLRSWLTIIGIVIGVGAIVAIVSIGEGAQANVQARLGGLGADIITVSPGFQRAQGGFRVEGGGGGGGGSTVASKNLTSKDIQIIKSVEGVAFVDGTVSGREDMSFLAETASVSIQGVDPFAWRNIVTTELESGRYLEPTDNNNIVIGYRIAHSLFKEQLGLNQVVTIGGKSFKVVGVLQQSGSFGSDDNQVVMPITLARDILDKGTTRFDSITVKVADASQAELITNETTDRLMVSRHVTTRTKDFSVTSAVAIQQRIETVTQTFTIFLAAIAAVSLLVGAVGIANTMFTSVLEKTKEIGVMKAIGAKNLDIMVIFLLNSGLVGLVGGLIGILLGASVSAFLPSLISGFGQGFGGGGGRVMTVIPASLLIGAIVVSVSIGMIAGAIPAYRASKLRPVDALRYE